MHRLGQDGVWPDGRYPAGARRGCAVRERPGDDPAHEQMAEANPRGLGRLPGIEPPADR